MSTFLDISLLVGFAPIFGFILVWVLVYGVLTFSKVLDLAQHMRAIIALMIAIITLFIPQVMQTLIFIVPWFTVMFIFIIFILIALMAFGTTKADIAKAVWASEGSGAVVRNTVIIISFIILASALGVVFFGGDAPMINTATNATATTSVEPSEVGDVGPGALLATIFHPKLLGVIFLMLISLFAVLQLAK